MSKKKPLKVIAGAPDQPLVIGDIKIPCYVLEDEIRVLSQSGIFLGLGASRAGGRSSGSKMPRIMASQVLAPFISGDLMTALNSPIQFQPQSGSPTAYGYRAIILADICEAVLAAERAGVLQKRHAHIAERCAILYRGFARIGIISLVDEATGYQEIRAKKALATILETFIAHDAQKWTRTFPIDFYKQIFKLRKWPWPVASDEKKPYTPQIIGCYTNDIVYDRLAPGILSELRNKNPIGPQGTRQYRHHQWFTPDSGHPKLKEHLASVIALMKASSHWTAFQRNLQLAFPKMNGHEQMFLDLDYH